MSNYLHFMYMFTAMIWGGALIKCITEYPTPWYNSVWMPIAVAIMFTVALNVIVLSWFLVKKLFYALTSRRPFQSSPKKLTGPE